MDTPSYIPPVSSLWKRKPLTEDVFSLADCGGSLKRLHGPTLLKFDPPRFQGKQVLRDLMELNPVCPQRGPYETSEGTHRGQAKKRADMDKKSVSRAFS